MEFRMRTLVLASVSALLIASLAPMAIADSGKKDDDSIWLDSGGKVSSNSRSKPEQGRFHRGPRTDRNPAGETPVAPVPEPGTMALMSLGLVSLAAAMRKRRAGRQPVSGTTL
jgi:hypothetical protein